MDLPPFDPTAIQVEDQRGISADVIARQQAVTDFLQKFDPVTAVKSVINAVRGEQPIQRIKPTINAKPYVIDLRKGLP